MLIFHLFHLHCNFQNEICPSPYAEKHNGQDQEFFASISIRRWASFNMKIWFFLSPRQDYVIQLKLSLAHVHDEKTCRTKQEIKKKSELLENSLCCAPNRFETLHVFNFTRSTMDLISSDLNNMKARERKQKMFPCRTRCGVCAYSCSFYDKTKLSKLCWINFSPCKWWKNKPLTLRRKHMKEQTKT